MSEDKITQFAITERDNYSQFSKNQMAFEHFVGTGEVNVDVALKLSEAALRLVPAAKLEEYRQGLQKREDLLVDILNSIPAEPVADEPKTEPEAVVETETEPVVEPEAEIESTEPEQVVEPEPQPETSNATPVESLELPKRIIDLLRSDTNGPAFPTVESIFEFLASGGDLSDAKDGIGPAMESAILASLPGTEG